MYDVIIIGAGVSGSAIARELSRYQLKLCVLEREEDVCCGTSKANSGIVHAGFDAEPGTLMAKLNVRGNKMMESLSHDLDFPFMRNGSLVVCHTADDISRPDRRCKRRSKRTKLADLSVCIILFGNREGDSSRYRLFLDESGAHRHKKMRTQ